VLSSFSYSINQRAVFIAFEYSFW